MKVKSQSISVLLTKNKPTNSYVTENIGEGRVGIKTAEKVMMRNCKTEKGNYYLQAKKKKKSHKRLHRNLVFQMSLKKKSDFTEIRGKCPSKRENFKEGTD